MADMEFNFVIACSSWANEAQSGTADSPAQSTTVGAGGVGAGFAGADAGAAGPEAIGMDALELEEDVHALKMVDTHATNQSFFIVQFPLPLWYPMSGIGGTHHALMPGSLSYACNLSRGVFSRASLSPSNKQRRQRAS